MEPEQRARPLRQRGQGGAQRVGELGAVQRLHVAKLGVGFAADQLAEHVLDGDGRPLAALEVERAAHRGDSHPRPQRATAAIGPDSRRGAVVADQEADAEDLAQLVEKGRCAVDAVDRRAEVGQDLVVEDAESARVSGTDRPGQEQVGQVRGRGPAAAVMGLGVGDEPLRIQRDTRPRRRGVA